MRDSDAAVPSERRCLLSELLGQVLTGMIRYSWLPPAEAAKEYSVPEQELFGRTAGPLALIFESGLVVGVSSESSKNSVVVWVERVESGEGPVEPLDEDEELHEIRAADSTYSEPRWAVAVGSRVAKIVVFRRVSQNLLLSELSSEAALQIFLDNGENIVLGHGLHDDSDDFAVLHEEEILPTVVLTIRFAVSKD